MNIELQDGRLSFDLAEAINQLTGEEKRAAITMLACDDMVITMVGQQIVDGMTDDGSRGGLFCHAPATPYYGLDKVLRDVAKASSGVARHEIERLETALAASEKQRWKLAEELEAATRRAGAYS